jgi:hypothetical protein
VFLVEVQTTSATPLQLIAVEMFTPQDISKAQAILTLEQEQQTSPHLAVMTFLFQS